MSSIPDTPTLTLLTPVEDLPGAGPRAARGLRRLGIRCLADLVLHLPSRYERELAEATIAELSDQLGPEHGNTVNLAVRGEIATVQSRRGRTSRVEITLEDGTGTVRIIWFNMAWMARKIHPGMRIRAWGKGKRNGDVLELANPRWTPLDEQDDAGTSADERLVPIYSANDEITSATIEAIVGRVLDAALALLDDHLVDDYRASKEMPTLSDAYRLLHRPTSDGDIAEGRRRLAFDELLFLQLAVMMKRHHRRTACIAPELEFSDAIDEHIRARLPFTLTSYQDQVSRDIAHDLQRSVPMNRLLQGDVGAGKTAIALYAMLMAVASGHQAALMAPTELLAEQHEVSLRSMLDGGRVQIDLITGSLAPAVRRERLERIAAGDTDLIIGTHALLTESVEFNSLAAVVIDEQHRFGVHQRATLRSKANDEHSAPHVLVMTATPIPRTLSLTLFGDLDCSVIHGRPPGRQPITTTHVPLGAREQAYATVRAHLERGEQAYIVVPVIEKTDSALRDVATHLDWLRQGPLAGFNLEAMHGRLDRETRDDIMRRFRAGDVQALVATTVIEVGVDVPNATIIAIEHAERFGLAQLHQMRGRVGRGTQPSACILIGDPTTDDGIARVDALVETDDGFRIAEKDLEIRGPGELFGARQSGLPPFRVADIMRDLELLQMARRDATEWIQRSPRLDEPQDRLLRRRLLKAYGEALGLGDVA
ncbi:MAG: ATP-dependent DNA helicase RecG [Planctomycetota bacterium]